MTRGSVTRLITCLALLAPMVVSSSSPETNPEPTYDFRFEGQVLSSDGAPLANFPVAALRDSTVLSLGWGVLTSKCPSPGRSPAIVTLSDDQGRFDLVFSLCRAPDSLAVGVVLPDTILMGPRYSRRALRYWEQDGYYSSTENGFLCDDTVSRTFLEAYVYDTIDTVTIVVPDGLVDSAIDGNDQ